MANSKYKSKTRGWDDRYKKVTRVKVVSITVAVLLVVATVLILFSSGVIEI